MGGRMQSTHITIIKMKQDVSSSFTQEPEVTLIGFQPKRSVRNVANLIRLVLPTGLRKYVQNLLRFVKKGVPWQKMKMMDAFDVRVIRLTQKYVASLEAKQDFAKEVSPIGIINKRHKHVNPSFMEAVKLALPQTNLKLRRFVRKLVQNRKGLSM